MDMSRTPPAARADPDDPRARTCIARWDELDSERSMHKRDWEEIDRLIRGQYQQMETGDTRHQQKPLSSAPHIALNHLAAGLYGTVSNPANRWMAVTVADRDLAAWGPMRDWLDLVSSRILASFRPSISPFYSASLQVYSDVVAFGTGAGFDEIVPGEGRIMDITLSLMEVVFDIDAFGRVRELIRRYRLNPVQAADAFGIDTLPPAMRERAERGSRERSDFYWHVFPNRDWMPGRIGPRGKKWTSLHVCAEGATVLRERGFAEMPFVAPRWSVSTGQTWGRGQGAVVLPDVRVLTQMDAANLRAAQRAADPTLLAPHKDAWPIAAVVRPGEVLYGGTSMSGQPLVRPLDTSSGTGLSLEMAQARIESIRDGMYWTLMTMAGRTGMTATEVIERNEEKMRLMAPYLGRLQEEYLAPKIARRFALLWGAGQLPPPPPEAGGTPIDIDYLSAAAMAQKSADGAAVVRLVADIAPLAQMGKTRVLDRINEDALIEALADARGAPSAILLSREQADEMSRARAEAQQAAQAMEAAQAGAGILRDVGLTAGSGGAA